MFRYCDIAAAAAAAAAAADAAAAAAAAAAAGITKSRYAYLPYLKPIHTLPYYRVLPCLRPRGIHNGILKDQKPHYSLRKTEVWSRSLWEVGLPWGRLMRTNGSQDQFVVITLLKNLRTSVFPP